MFTDLPQRKCVLTFQKDTIRTAAKESVHYLPPNKFLRPLFVIWSARSDDWHLHVESWAKEALEYTRATQREHLVLIGTSTLHARQVLEKHATEARVTFYWIEWSTQHTDAFRALNRAYSIEDMIYTLPQVTTWQTLGRIVLEHATKQSQQ